MLQPRLSFSGGPSVPRYVGTPREAHANGSQ